MILADYFISVKLDGDIILKEIAIIVTGTLFMCLCFRQRWIKTAIFVLLYQGICFVTDYISIIMLSKCFPTITMERLSEPLINAMLGILSQQAVADAECPVPALRIGGRKRKMEAVWHLGSDMLSFFRHIERDHCSVECPTA